MLGHSRNLVLVSAIINAYELGGISANDLHRLVEHWGYTIRRVEHLTYEIGAPDGSVTLAQRLPNLSVRLTELKPPPPAMAERMLGLLLRPDRLQEALGDFEEGFHLMLERHGIGYARRWYLWQVCWLAARGALDAAWKAVTIWTRLR